MNRGATGRPPPRGRRVARVLGALALLALLLAVSLRVALRPEFVVRQVLQRTGDALGLVITARGAGEYTLRGTPTLVVRDLDVREAGARTPLLRAERLLIAVPWSTLRSRGASLDVRRIELDAPVLDLPALRAWRAKRPPSDTRLPVLERGIAIARGRVTGSRWRVDDIDVDVPRFAPGERLAASARGRYVSGGTSLAFDLALAMTRPANDAGIAAVGTLTLASGDWSLPARIRVSGPLHVGDGGTLRIAPLRLAASARYASGDTQLPFALGVRSPLRFDGRVWTLAPAGVAVRGTTLLPEFDARGALSYGARLALRMQGRLPRWNPAWPALPPPLGQSDAPLPFRLDYAGPVDASGVARLQLKRDAATFDGRMRLPDVLAWANADATGSPIPPLTGRVSAPQVEISGAMLQGVEVEFSDPALPDTAAARTAGRSR